MAIVLVIFYVGKYYVADELIYANYQVEALQSDLQAALEQLANEKIRATVAEHEADVVRRANALLRGSERDRQDEIAGLQADLAFYRRLGSANGSQTALAIHHIELQQTESPRVFLLVFTLTQNLRWASGIGGQIQLGIDGIQSDIAVHLDADQLLAETADPLQFKFKYFQQFERLITLPESFAPQWLTIRLRSTSLETSIEQSIPWQELLVTPAKDDSALQLSKDSSPD